ncbi:3-deoxy-manno-octulosonate cytidylyltransferase [Eionea flava]
MPFTVVIPARFSSTRLPGKPLLPIGDKPMIQHVYEQALKSDAQTVVVATDDQRIVDAVEAFEGNVCMTSDQHVSGTDRIQEVAQHYSLADDHIIVNVQGDEPCIPPAVINQVASNLSSNPIAAAATLSETITDNDSFTNPNVVKVVSDHAQMALYFSRSMIPFPRDAVANKGSVKNISLASLSPVLQRHIGIYAYRVSLLHHFVSWSVSPLESIECLEQLRILHHSQKIHVETACEPVPGGVDTQEDIDRVRQDMSVN